MILSAVDQVNTKNIQTPLIENDILFLQNKFLETGFCNLKVKDIETGRLIISKVINSLNYFNDIAILTVCENSNQNYFNIKKALTNNYDISKNQFNLINFFLDQFYFDFLIIEATKELMSNNWAQNFEQHILDFNFHKTMPIIILTYENI
ncbi:MAG: hypothetical protein P4L22_00185 [Candidatus Babeliales bacterium]|nr:hypothetical protein [Candidatus Babeliales bacterium]